jgi:BirA family biotin operon repressor/biotin-[acetyl-CoA-carboxylase] ligase
LAETPFERARFEDRLATAFVGRVLELRDVTASTNDDAWAALAAGGPDGLAMIANEQRAGRGRAGRAWAHAPGLGLALSIGVRIGRDAPGTGLLPLAAGLAVAEALASLGAAPRLKWPNDVLLGSRKVAGVLCELRRIGGGDAVVIGIGVNVRQQAKDFPPELRERATSLALSGLDARPEDVAAATCAAFEARLLGLRAGERARVCDAWSERAAFWGEPITVRAPGGDVTGVALRLDERGGLVLRLESGAEWTAIAGDLLAGDAGAVEAR